MSPEAIFGPEPLTSVVVFTDEVAGVFDFHDGVSFLPTAPENVTESSWVPEDGAEDFSEDEEDESSVLPHAARPPARSRVGDEHGSRALEPAKHREGPSGGDGGTTIDGNPAS